MSFQKVALVTGGAQGVGKGIALRFLKSGFQVFIVDVDAEAGNETAAELGRLGKIEYLCCDVSSDSEIQDACSHISLVAGRLDVLINNAGIFLEKALKEMTLAEWNKVIAVNLTSAFLFAKYFESLLRASQGSIVNICSTRAFMSEPNTEAYAASKGGILSLTHALAISLGPDVRVNSISPGWIDVSCYKKSSQRHDMVHSKEDHVQHPVGRVGMVDDIAALALFLSSSDSSFVTGQNFTADGGMTKKMIYVP